MPSTRWIAIVAAAGAATAGVAIAASQPAQTTPVTAEFHADVVSQHQRQCATDHLKFRVVFKGAQTSSDPRLTGDLTARARSIVDTKNGYGVTQANVRVSDPATGKPKFKGHLDGVIEPDGGVEGFLRGRTTGPDSAALFANFNATQDQSTGAVTGELGKDTQTGASQDPAVLTNACRGGRSDPKGRRHPKKQGHR